MSQITNTDVEKLAELAMLEIPGVEVENLAKSINNILGYVGIVANADLSNVEAKQEFTNIARVDGLKGVLGSHEIVMQNVRQVSGDGYVEVSKVINK